MELHERLSPKDSAIDLETFDPFAGIKDQIHLSIIEDLGRQIFNTNVDPAALKVKVTDEIKTRLAQEDWLARDDRVQLAVDIADDILGHGPLEKLLADDTVTEIMVNGPADIWIERKGKLLQIRPPCASATNRICGGSSTRWSPPSGAGSTSRCPWWTPVFPTAAA